MRNCLILGSVLMTACSSTTLYSVDDAAKGGLPFYPVEQVDLVTTTYAQSWLKVVVEKVDGDLKQTSAGFWPLDAACGPKLRPLLLPDPENAPRLIADDCFKPAIPTVMPWAGDKDWPVPNDQSYALVGVVQTRVQRPSDHASHINVEIPYGGSGTGDLSFEKDGTLTNAKAEGHDDFPGKVADLVGTLSGSVLTYLGVLSTSKATVEAAKVPSMDSLLPMGTGKPPKEPPKYLVTISPMHREYTVECAMAATKQRATCNHATSSWYNVSIKVVDDSLPPSAEPKQEKDTPKPGEGDALKPGDKKPKK